MECRGGGVSPVLRVKHYRVPHPERWIIRALFVFLLLLAFVALVVR
jgi:hypothetical protein